MARTYTTGTNVYRSFDTDTDAPLIRWSAIFGGLILGLGLLLLLTALWIALAYGSNVTTIRANLDWYLGGSAVFALFVAGILTGSLSGVRGAGAGLLHGTALWALLLALTVTVGIPSILNVFSLGSAITDATSTFVDRAESSTLWASFWTIAAGFVAAGIGGAIGGMASRGKRVETRATLIVPEPAVDDEVDVHEYDTEPHHSS